MNLSDDLAPRLRTGDWNPQRNPAGEDVLSMVIGGDIRDAFEVITGRDMVTGVELSTAARVIAVAGFFVPVVSGALLRKVATRVGIEIAEEVGERAAREIAEEVVERAAKEAVEEASAESGQRVVSEAARADRTVSFGELKRAAQFLKDEGVDRIGRRRVIKAFGPSSEVRTLADDVVGYRYYGGRARPRGQWLATEEVLDPVNDLALPYGSFADRLQEWTVPASTKVPLVQSLPILVGQEVQRRRSFPTPTF